MPNNSNANHPLLASRTETSTGNGESVSAVGQYGTAVFQLTVTAAATEVGDLLDVFVQTRIDPNNWIDIVHFTTVLGNGGAKRYVAKINAGEPQAMFENSAALASGSVRNILGGEFRVRWVVVDVTTTGNQSFTFSVVANLIS